MDGSSLSECTIEHVKAIAKGCGVIEIIFLGVVSYARNSWVWTDNVGMGGVTNPDVVEKVMQGQRDKANDYLSRLAGEAKKDGLNAEIALIEGNPSEAIIDYARNNGVDLIVMSTHGRSGISRFALGSVTDRVVRTSPVPVLVVAPAGCRVSV